MSLILDFTCEDSPCATLANLDNLRRPLSANMNSSRCVSVVEDIQSPVMRISVDEQCAQTPFQHPSVYPVPAKYKAALKDAIDKEVKLGHLS
jgi:hypothetical protein